MLELIKKNKKILGIGVILFLGISYFTSDSEKTIKFDNVSPKFKIVKSEKICELASVDYFINYYNLVDRVPILGEFVLSDGIYLPHFNKIVKMDTNKLTKKNDTKFLCLEELEKKEEENLLKNIQNKVNNKIDEKIKIKILDEKELGLINNLHYTTTEEVSSSVTQILGYVATFLAVLFMLSLV